MFRQRSVHLVQYDRVHGYGDGLVVNSNRNRRGALLP